MTLQTLLIVLLAFALITLASERIGYYFRLLNLPLISGFLFTGVLAGPYLLGLIQIEQTEQLRFLDDVALGVIAFAAGSEFYLSELRGRLRSIAWITLTNTIFIPIIGAVSLYLLADFIPFMQDLSPASRLAAALVAGAILVARSPSSAIAIVNELRAKGPFTQMTLGVTMLTDVLVIILFAVMSFVADALIHNVALSLGFIGLLLAELGVSIIVGYGLGQLLHLLLRTHMNGWLKRGLVIIAGYAIFVLADYVRDASHLYLPFEFFLEPLLICMIGSFVITNYTGYRAEFMQIVHDIGPPIYVIFFTLTGASLSLDVLANTWQIAAILFGIRLVAIFIGSYSGGLIAGDPAAYNRLSWMTFVTQAGVGLGLAKEAAIEFPEWGAAFATMIISVIVVSQLVGPPLFKMAISRVGEARPRGQTPEFDGERDAIIFGLEDQSLALARLLKSHGWGVKIASRTINEWRGVNDNNRDIDIVAIPGLTLEAFKLLQAEQADAIIAMLSNEENYQICELAYEHYGTEHLVVRLTEREEYERFQELGAIIVDPSIATVNLLDLFVRSPLATSILLDMVENQAVRDLQVRNRHIGGLALRELRLPLDVLVLSLRRGNSTLVSHGYTRLELGDSITVVGSPESLEQVTLQIEG
ncbi:MAG: cation:proton antiporter [Caldilineaceae bacterium]